MFFDSGMQCELTERSEFVCNSVGLIWTVVSQTESFSAISDRMIYKTENKIRDI